MHDVRSRPRRTEADPERAAWRRDEQVIAVDAQDNELGLVSRTDAHGEDSIMHRAFMTLLIDPKDHVVLCRRSAHKRLWPLFWADSCAGHPLPGEDIRIAAERRLGEELGCTVPLTPIGRFIYKARFELKGYEYELCHVFVGPLCTLSPDPAEVAEVKAFDFVELVALMAEKPAEFAPWLTECIHSLPPSAFTLKG